MGNVVPLDIRKRQDIEDLANSMLGTFATEYRTAYGCEVLKNDEESDEYKFPFSLKFCPWERVDHPIRMGYLTKLGAIRKTWRRRYFVVQPNYLIHYYENEEAYRKGLKPKGTINPCGFTTVSNLEDYLAKRLKEMTAMLGVKQPDSLEKFPKHAFGIVHNKSRSYYIYADSDEDKTEWVQMFQLCCACVRGFNISDPICQSTFKKAVSKMLTAYGHPEYHSYKGPEEKVLCDMVTAEIDSRFMAEICENTKGNFAAKIKIRDQVLKELDTSVMNLVTPLWKNLMEETDNIRLKVWTLIRESYREIATVRRKIEWEMNGHCETFLNDAIAQVKTSVEKVAPILEKCMINALCEVQTIYQRNVVEISVDVEQREEVEIPIEMYIDSLDMLARTPSEIEAAYQHLHEMEKTLRVLQNDLNTFAIATIMSQAQEKLREVMDALVNTFQQRFLEVSIRIEGKQKHKQLRNMIEDVDDEVANNFENDTNEIIYSFNMKILKSVFLPYIHKNIDANCSPVVKSADCVIPEHLKIVLNRNNEYKRLIERSVEQLLKQVMNKDGEEKQRSFRSSLRNSRRKTFPKFSSRRTKFQDAKAPAHKTLPPVLKRNGVASLSVTKTELPRNMRERKSSFTYLLTCLPLRDSGVYDESDESSEDNMQEIRLTLERDTAQFRSKT